MNLKNSLLAAGSLLAAASATAFAAPQVFTAAGAAPAELQTSIDAFRAKLGANNAGAAGPFASGFRNINWDGAPDTVSAPNLMPAAFFNSTTPRGAVFTAPGGVMMSSTAASGTPVRFGQLDASYSTLFRAFTEQRLFAAIGGTWIDTTFFVPSSPATAGTVSGFGVVFCDVDLPNESWLEFFGTDGRSLGKYYPTAANNGLSFLGVFFADGERVARVRVTHGNQALGAGKLDTATLDAVATDDFMYSEPLPQITDGLIGNVANRSRVGTGGDVQITGFVLRGTQPKTILIRAAGPALTAFGVTGALTNPQLALFGSAGQALGTNDDWAGKTEVAQAAARSGAFPFSDASADAALLVVLNPGSYTVITSGVGASTGSALTEVYEVR